MIEIHYSDVIKDISIMMWLGKNPRSGWEEYGSPSLDFGGAPGTNFSCGAFLRGILRCCAPQALAPQKSPAKRTEQLEG